ncbi:MAG: hypothetical protein VX346_10310 [Planctomycetota bacterium]|nr:hypothetical protein [Planctomycetota bacterium]
MIVCFFFQLPAFCLGAVAAGAPQLLRASEASRDEPTMGPGIFMFLGFGAVILGGLIADAMSTTVLWVYAWWDHARGKRP